MRQHVTFRLTVQRADIAVGEINRLYPITGGINHHRDASTCRAARDQHRYHAYG